MPRTEQQRRQEYLQAKKERARRLTEVSSEVLPTLPKNAGLLSYRISFEPFDVSEDKALTDALKDIRATLWDQIHDDPQAAIPVLKELLTRFPDDGRLLNWLAAAQANAGALEESEATALRNFEQNPNYLFARINQANMRLHAGDIAAVEEIFDGKYDLKLLHPEREIFHASEFAAFSALIVSYWIKKGNFRAARSLVEAMQQVIPGHPATVRAGELLEGIDLLETARRLSQNALRQGYLPRL